MLAAFAGGRDERLALAAEPLRNFSAPTHGTAREGVFSAWRMKAGVGIRRSGSGRRLLPHQPEIMFGVLIVIFSQYPVAGPGRSACQREIALVVLLGIAKPASCRWARRLFRAAGPPGGGARLAAAGYRSLLRFLSHGSSVSLLFLAVLLKLESEHIPRVSVAAPKGRRSITKKTPAGRNRGRRAGCSDNLAVDRTFQPPTQPVLGAGVPVRPLSNAKIGEGAGDLPDP